MDKKQKNHNANISNPNEGTKGVNQTHAKNVNNRANQLNPNNKNYIKRN